MANVSRLSSVPDTTPVSNLHLPATLLALTGISLFSTGISFAAEWHSPAPKLARIQGDKATLTVYCDDGEGNSGTKGLVYHIVPKKPLKQQGNSLWNLEISTKTKMLSKNGQRVTNHGGKWTIYVLAKHYLGHMKAGSRLDFVYGRNKDADRFTFTLNGSAKALDSCFNTTPPKASFQTSHNDIVGLKTGLTFQQFVEKLPDHFDKKRRIVNDTSVSYFGNQTQHQAWIKFNKRASWRHQTAHQSKAISITMAPPTMDNRVLTINRALWYDTLRHKHEAPLFTTVVKALKQKYGQPSRSYRKNGYNRDKGGFMWMFGPNGKPYGNRWPLVCEKQYKLKGAEWGYLGNDNKLREFIKTYGPTRKECGRTLSVSYTLHGPYLNALELHFVDLPLINVAMFKTYKHIKQKGEKRIQDQLNAAKTVAPKF